MPSASICVCRLDASRLFHNCLLVELDPRSTPTDDAVGGLIADAKERIGGDGSGNEADSAGLLGRHVSPGEHDLRRARLPDGSR